MSVNLIDNVPLCKRDDWFGDGFVRVIHRRGLFLENMFVFYWSIDPGEKINIRESRKHRKKIKTYLEVKRGDVVKMF